MRVATNESNRGEMHETYRPEDGYDAQPYTASKILGYQKNQKSYLSGSIVNMAESASIKFVLQVSGSCSRQLATCSSLISIREGTFVAVRDHRTTPNDHMSTYPHNIAAC